VNAAKAVAYRVGFAASIAVALYSANCFANERSLLIYYANETVQEALSSRNYSALFSLLDDLPADIATKAKEGLSDDAKGFRDQVDIDIQALTAASKTKRYELAAFTNAAALRGSYYFVDSGATELRKITLPQKPLDPAREYSPLASVDFLAAALTQAVRGYDASDRIILIINSHGTKKFAVIPRVAGDFTSVDPTRILDQLNRQAGSDLAVDAVQIQGITKVQLWKVLSSLRAATGIGFSLVFLQACESAVSSWGELELLPSSGVQALAHSGFGSISPTQINYGRLVEPAFAADDRDTLALLKKLLSESGMYIDSRYSLWIWPLLVLGASIPKFVFFLPLAVFLALSLLSWARSRRFNTSGRNRAL
jgi:hypothetical protein